MSRPNFLKLERDTVNHVTIRSAALGERRVGPGYPSLIAAEVGINHNGDRELALRSIEAAAAAGADAVKFQNYRTEDFISDTSLTYEYISNGVTTVESQYEMFKRCELRSDDLLALREHCDECGVYFFSTPTSESGVEDLVRMGAPLLKNGSDYLTHLPLIRAMARTGIPTIVSTGMATAEEIRDATNAFRDAGGSELILLHCTSAYPTQDEDVNLRRMQSMEREFECLVGFSDHTWGTTAAATSSAIGACMIEKHFTLNKNLPGPDHRFSSDPEEFRQLVENVRRVERQLGSSAIKPSASESDNRSRFRLSCVAAMDLSAGHRLRLEDIAFRRPGTGLAPKHAPELVGRTLFASVRRGELLGPSLADA